MTDPTDARRKLGDLLVAAGAIDESDLVAALEEQRESRRPLGMILVRMGVVDERTLIRALAGQLHIPVVRLRGKRVNPEILEIIPIDLAEKHRCLPLLIKHEGETPVLYLAMEDPAQTHAVEEISDHIGMKVQAVLVAPTELDECIHRHYHWASYGEQSIGSTLDSSRPPSAALGGGLDPAPLSDSSVSDDSLSDDSLSDDSLSGSSLSDSPLSDNSLSDSPVSYDPLGESASLQFDAEPQFVEHEVERTEDPEREVFEFTASPPTTTAPVADSVAMSNDAMLRAIAQLLVEKGVFSRDELVERLRVVANERDPG